MDNKNNNSLGASYMGTGATGKLLEMPFYLPIFDGLSSNEVPFSIKLTNPDTQVFKFQIPNNGETNVIVTGWYAMLVRRVEAEAGKWRLVVVDTDSQNITDNSIPTATPVYQYGYQSGGLIQYTWQLGDINFGSYHHGHKPYHWRLFAVSQSIPAGASGQLSILLDRVATKWMEFFYSGNFYLYCGLIGRRELTVPPPFNIDSSLIPVKNIGQSLHRLTVPNSNAIGSLGSSSRQSIKLTNRHPTLIDQVVISGELDGVYIKCDWNNGNLCDNWLPALLFAFQRSAGLIPCPIFMAGNTNINFDIAQGLRLSTTPDNAALISIDISGASYGF